jgi:hypothetical protein
VTATVFIAAGQEPQEIPNGVQGATREQSGKARTDALKGLHRGVERERLGPRFCRPAGHVPGCRSSRRSHREPATRAAQTFDLGEARPQPRNPGSARRVVVWDGTDERIEMPRGICAGQLSSAFRRGAKGRRQSFDAIEMLEVTAAGKPQRPVEGIERVR